jgi:hypothetical protein
MSHSLIVSFRAMVVAFGFAISATACLAASDVPAPTSTETGDDSHEQSWYREQSTKADSLAIVQQKAQTRAQQRMDRLASLQWYGMSNSRPLASPTPFMTRYSPLWEMPGGRPFSWYPYARPGYVMYWR